jgi:hypothetical protein
LALIIIKITVAKLITAYYNNTTPTIGDFMNLYIRLIIILAVINVATRYLEIQ